MDRLQSNFRLSEKIGTVAICGLVAMAVCASASLIIPSVMGAEAVAGARATLVMISLLLALFAAVVAAFFIAWMALAYRNLQLLDIPNLQYTMGWAIGGWFVPVLNLVRPYQVMSEIWEQTETYCRLAEDRIFEQPATTSLILTWWVLFLGRGVWNTVGVTLFPLAVSAWIGVVVVVSAATFACLVVRDIRRLQAHALELALRMAEATRVALPDSDVDEAD